MSVQKLLRVGSSFSASVFRRIELDNSQKRSVMFSEVCTFAFGGHGVGINAATACASVVVLLRCGPRVPMNACALLQA